MSAHDVDGVSHTTDVEEDNVNEMYVNFMFECVVSKLKSVFRLDENHPDEKVEVTIKGNNVILMTETKVEYKADKTFLTNDEWKALNE